MIEDTHSSYWYEYGGGLKKRSSFIEYAKNLVDIMHAWHIKGSSTMKVNHYIKSIRGIHFYDSIVVLEKSAELSAPYNQMMGNETINYFEEPELRHHNIFSRIWFEIKRKLT